MHKTIVTTLLSLLLLSAPAVADVLVGVLEPPSVTMPVEMDLGGVPTGVVEVTMRVTGYAGGHRIFCDDMGGGYELWYQRIAMVWLDGESYGEAVLPLRADFDETAVIQLEPGVVDWSHLADGRVMVEIAGGSTLGSGMPYDCYSVGSEPMVMNRLEVTVNAAHAVDAAPTAWSTIKAMYR